MTHRILLIEDDARLATMVSDYLGEAGFRVSDTASGVEAERLLKGEGYDATTEVKSTCVTGACC